MLILFLNTFNEQHAHLISALVLMPSLLHVHPNLRVLKTSLTIQIKLVTSPPYPHSQPVPCVHSAQCVPRRPSKLNGSTLDLL